MAKIEILVLIAFAALVYSSEVDEVDQKKRGVGKPNNLNTIPTGVQKSEYAYNIYSQNPSVQSNQYTQPQQQQVSNSFYPSQGNQYYTSSNPGNDASSSYAQQPQIHLAPPPSSSQFVPLNFVPSSGYQSKYQFVQPKPGHGNIQLAIIPQPSNVPTSPLLSYPQLFSPATAQSVGLHQPQALNLLPSQSQFNIAPNFHSLPFGSPHLSQSSMLLLAPNPSLYNNLLYQNPLQNYYNYNPLNSQTHTKYSLSYGTTPQASSVEYEKSAASQSISKEDNDIAAQSNEYISSSDSNPSYKSAYVSNSYSKL